jgi:hypothetical protein
MDEEMQLKKFLFISDIPNYNDGGEIAMDWYTFGVIYHKSTPLKTLKGQELIVFYVTDLNGSFFRLFLRGDAYKSRRTEEVGSVIGIMNAKIMVPSQQNAAIALCIDSPDYFVHLGTSPDLDWCQHDGCLEVINKQAKITHCPLHRDARYHKALSKRQELAVGTAQFVIGAPDQSKLNNRCMKTQAVYMIEKEAVVAEGYKIMVRKPLEPTTQSATKDQMYFMLF